MRYKTLSLVSVAFLLWGGFSAVVYADGVLGVTNTTADRLYAQAGGGYAAGWRWTLLVTVPDNEPVLRIKFGNWTNASSSFSPAGNVRFYSAQSSNAADSSNAASITAVDTYSNPLNLLPTINPAFDLSSTTPGRQIEVIVETKIPADAAGGSYTGSFGVQTLPDTMPPVITLIGNASITIERGASYTEQGATATDNIDSTIASSSVAVSGSVITSSIGTYALSYTISDAAGNAATPITRTVLVQDTVAPTGSVSYSTTATTSANVVATLVPSEPVTFLNTIGIATTTNGTATTTFTENGSFSFLFADVANNTGSTTASVANIDKVMPTITSFSLNGSANDIAVNIASTSIAIALSASESVNWLSVKVENQGNTSVYKLFQSGVGCEDGGTTCTKVWTGDLSSGVLSDGTYRVRVRMKDAAGNETDGYINKVIILDTTAPIITITGNAAMNIYIGASYTDAGAIAVDARDGTVSVSSSGSVNANAVGDYTVTYTATDALGNTVSKTRTVQVLPILVTSITVSGATTVQVSGGQDVQMSVNVSPDNATNKTVTWSVFNNQGKATINATTGLLHGVQQGFVRVTASAADGSGVSSENFSVLVQE